jgi:hypothetical protein
MIVTTKVIERVCLKFMLVITYKKSIREIVYPRIDEKDIWRIRS